MQEILFHFFPLSAECQNSYYDKQEKRKYNFPYFFQKKTKTVACHKTTLLHYKNELIATYSIPNMQPYKQNTTHTFMYPAFV